MKIERLIVCCILSFLLLMPLGTQEQSKEEEIPEALKSIFKMLYDATVLEGKAFREMAIIHLKLSKDMSQEEFNESMVLMRLREAERNQYLEARNACYDYIIKLYKKYREGKE